MTFAIQLCYCQLQQEDWKWNLNKLSFMQNIHNSLPRVTGKRSHHEAVSALDTEYYVCIHWYRYVWPISRESTVKYWRGFNFLIFHSALVRSSTLSDTVIRSTRSVVAPRRDVTGGGGGGWSREALGRERYSERVEVASNLGMNPDITGFK